MNSKDSQAHPFLEELALVLGMGGVAMLLFALALALFGFFTSAVILGGEIGMLAGVVAVLLFRFRASPPLFTSLDRVALIFILVVSLSAAVFHHDVPLGRDDMGYLTAAIKLEESGSLAFEDIITHPFHPYIEISENVFTSQFLPGYYTYLALWYVPFGLNGIFVANSFLLFVFLLSLYSIGRRIVSPFAGLLAVTFLSTSYLFLWFPRRTLSENLLAVLLWLGVLSFTRGISRGSLWSVGMGFLPVSLILLVRGEAVMYVLAYLVCLLGVLIWWHRQKSLFSRWPRLAGFLVVTAPGSIPYVLLRVYTERYTPSVAEYTARASSSILHFLIESSLLYGGIALAIFGWVCTVFIARFTRQKMQRQWSKGDIALVLALFVAAIFELIFYEQLAHIETVDWKYLKSQFVFENFTYYMVTPFAIIGALGFLRRRLTPLVWIPLLLILPAFAFFIEPSIAVDQPWFMRRFFATLVPLAFLLASIALASFFPRMRERILVIIIGVLLNLSIAWPVAFYSDHKGIRPDLERFASEFASEDLLLMEPGWRWQQWAYALHYIYDVRVLPNTDGLRNEEIGTLLREAKQVFIVSSRTSLIHPFYNDSDLEFVKNWEIDFQQMIPTTSITGYVDEEKRNLSVFKIRTSQKGTPPNVIVEKVETYYVYRVREGVVPILGVVEGYQTF